MRQLIKVEEIEHSYLVSLLFAALEGNPVITNKIVSSPQMENHHSCSLCS